MVTMDIPSVRWGDHDISRLVLGHNPVKGGSHHSRRLDEEMRTWHEPIDHRLALLRRAEECGITTVQFGGGIMFECLQAHAAEGGMLTWIATHYGNDGGNLGRGANQDFAAELDEILAVTPTPIGIQHFGEKTDRLYFEGKLDVLEDRLKRLRDTGCLVGVGTHLVEVAEEIASRGWDVDFYQTSLYTVYSHSGEKSVDREHEVFDDTDRDSMLSFVSRVDKPCIVFKILAANRRCDDDEAIRASFEEVYRRIKPCDVALVGMWQKHRDQIGFNSRLVSSLLAVGA